MKKEFNPLEKMGRIEEEKLDQKIDLEAEIGKLSVQLHEAEFPSEGEPDEKKAKELETKIEELKKRQRQIDSEK